MHDDTITLEQGWTAVREALPSVKAAAFDGCHKIYLLQDDRQVTEQEDLHYPHMVYAANNTAEAMLGTLHRWFDESCPLRFIDAVRTVEGDPSDGFTALIPQGAE